MPERIRQQRRANEMDERLEHVAIMAEREGWFDIAKSIRDVRLTVRKNMHRDDRAATMPVV